MRILLQNCAGCLERGWVLSCVLASEEECSKSHCSNLKMKQKSVYHSLGSLRSSMIKNRAICWSSVLPGRAIEGIKWILNICPQVPYWRAHISDSLGATTLIWGWGPHLLVFLSLHICDCKLKMAPWLQRRMKWAHMVDIKGKLWIHCVEQGAPGRKTWSLGRINPDVSTTCHLRTHETIGFGLN